MRTILIAHGDVSYAGRLAAELRADGYRVICCPGPWPPVTICIRCDRGYCPLTEDADLMIYDPELTALDGMGHRYNLAVDSARALPDVPMLLAWSPAQVPDTGTLRAIDTQTPYVHVAAPQPAVFRRQVHDFLAPTFAPARQV